MSDEFAAFCAGAGIVRSVGRIDVCYYIAWAELFNGTLKVERVNRTVYPTRGRAIQDVTRYIELPSNEKRIHSAIGYLTPNEMKTAWYNQHQAA